jgi:hypothetical protein
MVRIWHQRPGGANEKLFFFSSPGAIFVRPVSHQPLFPSPLDFLTLPREDLDRHHNTVFPNIFLTQHGVYGVAWTHWCQVREKPTHCSIFSLFLASFYIFFLAASDRIGSDRTVAVIIITPAAPASLIYPRRANERKLRYNSGSSAWATGGKGWMKKRRTKQQQRVRPLQLQADPKSSQLNWGRYGHCESGRAGSFWK